MLLEIELLESDRWVSIYALESVTPPILYSRPNCGHFFYIDTL